MQAATQLWVSTCLLVVLFAVAYGDPDHSICNSETDDYKPDPNRPCTHFIRCNHGASVSVECPPYTVYSHGGICNHPFAVPHCANEKHEPSINSQQGHEYLQPPLHHQGNVNSGNKADHHNTDAPQSHRPQTSWNGGQQQPSWNNQHPSVPQQNAWNQGRPGQQQPSWNTQHPSQPQQNSWNQGRPGQQQPSWNAQHPSQPQQNAWNQEHPAQNQQTNWQYGRANQHY